MVPDFINISQADTSQFSSVSNNIWSYEGDHFNISTLQQAHNFLLWPLINGVVSPELAKKKRRKLAGPETIQNVKTGSGRQGDKDNWKNGLFGLRDFMWSHSRVSHVISVVARGHSTALYSNSSEKNKTKEGSHQTGAMCQRGSQ